MRGFCICLALAAGAFAIPVPAISQAVAPLLGPQAWVDHVVNDMMPFFTIPDAQGSPIGAFPGRRCNDGTMPDPTARCADVSSSEANNPKQYLVAQSRQIFAYATAFHMTGNTEYLDLAKVGTAYLFETYPNPGGIFRENLDVNTGTLGPLYYARNVQRQAYGLLGPTMLYYITKDEALYGQISAASDAITSYFGKAGTGSYSWNPFGDVAGSITASLDPLNTYIQLLSRVAPDPDRAAFRDQAHLIATYLRDTHFVPERGLFDTDLASTSDNLDFGHSAKSLWFIAMAAAQSGDADLAAFAKGQAAQLFSQAFVEDLGSWATSATATTRNDDANWWISAELGQLAASLAMTDPALLDMLSQTQDFWLTYFVDQENKGIWSAVDSLTGDPLAVQRKQWEWKSGFHELEHALVSYITAAEMSETDPVLWFARATDFSFETAYLFDADPIAVESVALDGGGVIQGVTFSGITFATIAAVPLGPTAWFLTIGLLALGGRARRVAKAP